MDLNKFRKNAALNKKSFRAFLKKFDTKLPADLNQIVQEEDDKVWANTDCLTCANCCKTMTPTFTAKDLKRIALHFRLTVKDFKEKWLYKDKKGDWMNVSTPCQFLLPDNKCSIYAIRPEDCAEFPHHHKKPFDEYNDTFKNNVEHCPATYALVKALKERIENEYVW